MFQNLKTQKTRFDKVTKIIAHQKLKRKHNKQTKYKQQLLILQVAVCKTRLRVQVLTK